MQVVVLTVRRPRSWAGTPTSAGVPPALAGAVLATVAFAGLGLWMAGTLRGEMTLALANGLYLVLLLLGGMVIPLDELPDAVRTVRRAAAGRRPGRHHDGALTAGGDIAAAVVARAGGLGRRRPGGRRPLVPLGVRPP